MNGGEIIARVLKKNGVQFLFTLCGGHVAPVYVEAAKTGIRVIDVRNEATSVYAADALSRLTANTGVAVVTAGPGITNSITALKNAQLAQSPMLVIAGASATLLRNRGALQDIDQAAIVKSLVKKIITVSRLKDLATAVQDAIDITTRGVPGPVYLECPVDLLYDEALVKEMYLANSNNEKKSFREKIIQAYIRRHTNRLFNGAGTNLLTTTKKIHTSTVPVRQVKQLASLINQSSRPVLVVGSGAMSESDLVNTLATAINQLNIPTYLSGMARGLLGHKNPIHCHHKRKVALKKADLIILAGLPCDFRLNYGKELSRQAKKITISLDKTELRKNIHPDLAIHDHPARCIIALQNEKFNSPDWHDWKKELTERETIRESEIDEMAKQELKFINPVSLFQKMEQLLPENSIIISDGGDFAATSSYILHPRKPLSWLDSGVFGTLGVGAGFALGAALCNPGDYVFIVYGDGSAGYSLAEFDTFTKCGLKICAIIGNNGSWEQVARDQVQILGAATATDIPRSDYQLIAKAFGADGERTDTLNDFEQAMKNAIASMDKGIPYLINAIIGSTSFREGSISM